MRLNRRPPARRDEEADPIPGTRMYETLGLCLKRQDWNDDGKPSFCTRPRGHDDWCTYNHVDQFDMEKVVDVLSGNDGWLVRTNALWGASAIRYRGLDVPLLFGWRFTLYRVETVPLPSVACKLMVEHGLLRLPPGRVDYVLTDEVRKLRLRLLKK